MESAIRDEGVVLRLWSGVDKATAEDIVTASRAELDGWLPGLASELQNFEVFVERAVRCASDQTGWYYAVEADGARWQPVRR